MPWSNIEVISVELVKDMSYDTIIDKMIITFQESGMKGVYDEAINNFSIALYEANKKLDTSDAMVLQCEESLNILIGTLLAFINMLDYCFGYSVMASRVLDNLACLMGKCDYNKIRNVIINSERYIQMEIDNQIFWADEKALIRAEQLSYFVSKMERKSPFALFVDYLLKIINIIESNYEKCEIEELYKAVSTCVSYYAVLVGNKKTVNQDISDLIFRGIDNIYLKCKRSEAKHPFCHAINRIINEENKI